MTGAQPISRRQVTLPLHIVGLAADELRSTTGDRVDLRPRSYVRSWRKFHALFGLGKIG